MYVYNPHIALMRYVYEHQQMHNRNKQRYLGWFYRRKTETILTENKNFKKRLRSNDKKLQILFEFVASRQTGNILNLTIKKRNENDYFD